MKEKENLWGRRENGKMFALGEERGDPWREGQRAWKKNGVGETLVTLASIVSSIMGKEGEN